VARGRERWVINKLRALCAWYTRGFERGSEFRVRVNKVASVSELRNLVDDAMLAGSRQSVGAADAD
jgi:hypothetical protein